MKPRSGAVTAVMLVVSAWLVGACSQPTAREAAGEEVGQGDGLAAPSAEALVGGIRKSTRLCIRNESSKAFKLKVPMIDNYEGNTQLDPGGYFCGERGGDLTMSMNLLKGLVTFTASNPFIGEPSFAFKDYYMYQCVSGGIGEMQRKVAHDGVLEYEFMRLQDTGSKEFQVTLRDDPNPSPNGRVQSCQVTG